MYHGLRALLLHTGVAQDAVTGVTWTHRGLAAKTLTAVQLSMRHHRFRGAQACMQPCGPLTYVLSCLSAAFARFSPHDSETNL